MNFSDVTKDPRFLDLSRGDIRSALTTPLLADGTPIGIINIESTQPRAFDFIHEEALSALAGQIVVALDNSQAHQDLEETLAALNARQEQLFAAQQLAALGNISGHLAHRMNNLIGSIRLLGKFMITTDGMPPSAVQKATQVTDAATEALQVIEDYRALFASSKEPTPFFGTVRAGVLAARVDRNIKLDIELPTEELIMDVPQEQLREIFKELVTNCGKALEQWDGTRCITVRGGVNDGHAIITVLDTGPGVPANTLDAVWTLGRRGQTDSPGMGFGLWWVRTFLTMYAGGITITNRPNAGLLVTITLPVKPTHAA